jgi:hypothetical protein
MDPSWAVNETPEKGGAAEATARGGDEVEVARVPMGGRTTEPRQQQQLTTVAVRLVRMDETIKDIKLSAPTSLGAKTWQLSASPTGLGWFLVETHATVKVMELASRAPVPMEARATRGPTPSSLTWYVPGPSTLRVERPGYGNRDSARPDREDRELCVQVVSEREDEKVEKTASWTLMGPALVVAEFKDMSRVAYDAVNIKSHRAEVYVEPKPCPTNPDTAREQGWIRRDIGAGRLQLREDRKSTRLNSSHT